MKLITKEIDNKIKKNPLYSNEDLENPEDAKIIVKFFALGGRETWLITEGEKQKDGDYLFYGYCYMLEGEWGYVTLSQLEELGDLIERDLYLSPDCTVGEELKLLGLGD